MTNSGTSAQVAPPFSRAVAVIFDAAVVLIFALAGRSSHERSRDVADVLAVAWPFLIALLAGWALVTWVLRTPPLEVRSGAVLWAVTLGGGMALRAATGGTVAVSFVLVAGVFLAVLLIGWRLVARAFGGRGHR